MKTYIARQPIYNIDKSLFGYELLYRNSEKNCYSSVDDDKATRELTYNVLSEFDFNSLTNEKYGFINFTKDSLMSDLPLLFNPEKIIIEILENVLLDQVLIDRVAFLKSKKYTFALDDFIDDGTYHEILPYIDIIKVEYNLLDSDIRTNIAKKYMNSKRLIAERIETQKEYNDAINDGYKLFQGYYFSKPIMISKASINIASSTYLRLWREISNEEPNFNALADIIKVDAGLTYKLLSLMNTPVYYRGRKITSIKEALLWLGLNETKRWVMLFFLRDASNTDNDEFAKLSLIRAIFMEKLIVKLGYRKMAQDTYMVGLLSMIENILEEDIISILDTLDLSDNTKAALINKNGIIYEVLGCIKEYELRNWNKVEEFNQRYNLDKDIISSIYLESLKYADDMLKIKEI
ncbi:EAL and HDOD domain-containing protein [Romboutsia sp.]|uniref:EAL and HDOD domain-containing protein n=1 Tax=Romboutsia sp. TaxID=1965302 RepID=UPI003F324582